MNDPFDQTALSTSGHALLENLFARLESDDEALIVLKGHLVLEERLAAIIEKFVFAPRQLERARLSFAQKVAVSRSMSLDESDNPVWEVIERVNALRNKLAHSLDDDLRAKAMTALKAADRKVHEQSPSDYESEDNRVFLGGVVAMCLGFLHTFEEEVERFRQLVHAIDIMANPHRHLGERTSAQASSAETF